MLKQAAPPLDSHSEWDEVGVACSRPGKVLIVSMFQSRSRFENEEAFKSVTVEADRKRLFSEYIEALQVSLLRRQALIWCCADECSACFFRLIIYSTVDSFKF